MTERALSRRVFIACVGTLPAWSAATAAPPLLLAQEAPGIIDPSGYLVSEKFDGVRAVWDGSSLHFRSGLPIAAPRWFTAQLPDTALDGELWLGRGEFERLSGIVRRYRPDDVQWRQLRYMLFELPGAAGDFAERAARIAALVQRTAWPQLVAVEQARLTSRQALQRRLDEVVAEGGEGLMLHRANALYEAGRSSALLKLKPLHDAEAAVIGHVAGRGKHAGRLGALRVRTAQGVDFLIGTGFSDAQRENPPAIGALVTFSHRGFTADGVPRFASFLRVCEP